MRMCTSPPVTVIYRGNLQDTALIVGLAYSSVNISRIAYTGELNERSKRYCRLLSEWLQGRGLPPISIHPKLTGFEMNHILSSPLKKWNWGDSECKAVIRLSNLPLP